LRAYCVHEWRFKKVFSSRSRFPLREKYSVEKKNIEKKKAKTVPLIHRW
jgi:hypothetical protein